MTARAILTPTAAVVAISALVQVAELSLAAAQATTRAETATERTSWGDPDLQGEWTSEGEYGVPLERAAPYGTRRFLTDAEYAKRLEEVRIRDERDLARVDVLSGKVDAPNAPIPHWREYNTTSRRTSLIVDPPDGRLPPRVATARPVPVQRCGSLQRGEPCDPPRLVPLSLDPHFPITHFHSPPPIPSLSLTPHILSAPLPPSP